jgi:adenylate cyclase
VAGAIAEEINITLTPQEHAVLTSIGPVNTGAHELYLKGRYYWNKRTEEGVRRGIGYFQQAIEQDPSYSLAYAGLADCYNVLGFWNFITPKEAYPRAMQAATRALELDEALAEAHTSLAEAKVDYDWDWPGAEKEFKRAIELKPSYATAHEWYADYFLIAMGRQDEAIAEINRAQALDPLSLIINEDVGAVLYFARRYDQAIEQLRKTLELEPEFAATHAFLAQTPSRSSKRPSLSPGAAPVSWRCLHMPMQWRVREPRRARFSTS